MSNNKGTSNSPNNATNSPANSQSALARKISKLLETRTDSKEIQTAIDNLDLLINYGKNNLTSRRNLRSNIEKKGIENNMLFLSSFMEVQRNLEDLQREVSQMSSSCNQMLERLSYTKDISGNLLHQAQLLHNQRKKNEMEIDISLLFLKKFQLTEIELIALRGTASANEVSKLNNSNINSEMLLTSSGNINNSLEAQNYLQADFFTALDRLQEIERECKSLLRTQHQRIAMEILDEMALIEETAFRRLYKWFRNECKKLNSLYPFFFSPSNTSNSSNTSEASHTSSSISPLFRDAIEALKSKPVLLGYCVDEITTTRNKVIVKTFLSALSQHKSSSSNEETRSPNKPIEIHAHDPIRYVGDMLAWIHQSLANESELLQALLFSSPPSSTNTTTTTLPILSSDKKLKEQEEESNFHEILSTYKILDAIFEGVCRPFKVRVEQVILSITANYQTSQSNSKNKNSSVLAYRLANLFHFYSRTVQKIMNSLYHSYISIFKSLHSPSSSPPSSILINTIEECKQESLKIFFDLLKDHADKLQRSPPVAPSNLMPPLEINEAINRLKEIALIYESSLISGEGSLSSSTIELSNSSNSNQEVLESKSNSKDKEGPFKAILSAIIDPILTVCNLIASRLSAADMAVFMINCLSSLLNALEPFEFTKVRIEMIQAHIKAHMDTLVAEQATSILNTCGLSSKLSILQSLHSPSSTNNNNNNNPSSGKEEAVTQTSLPLSSILDRKSITDTIQAFESMLVETAGSLFMPQCERLQNSQLRLQARNSVNLVVYHSYQLFYSSVTDPSNKYTDAESFFLYKPEQVKVMLNL